MASSAPSRDFHHPYEPYDIQLDFMNGLFDCLEHGRVGIFESPTGTGKSLSLICGSLTWLRDYRARRLAQDLADDDQVTDEPAWVVEHDRKRRRAVALQHKADLHARLQKVRAAEDRARQRFESGEPPSKRHKAAQDASRLDEADDDARFLLDDYESDQDRPHQDQHLVGLSAKTISMLDKLGHSTASKEEEDLEPDELKIFFCSRTHSQLNQFVNELRRTDFASSMTQEEDSRAEETAMLLDDGVKHLPLGSRKNLCINPRVTALGSNQAINERCLELQSASTSKESRCKYLPNRDKQALVHDFRDNTLAKVRDIEDLGRIGRKIDICPYYAARSAIRPSELVTLPYPLLLQRAAREALNISLKGHIVIIDEAHNLMDSISTIHSVSVRRSQVQNARAQLMRYLAKFRMRLKGKNRVYVAQVVRLLDSLLACLGLINSRANSTGQINASDLLAGKGVDQINLYKVAQYLRESKLAHKVDGYAEFSKSQEKPNAVKTSDIARNLIKSTTPVLICVQEFIQVLTNPDPEGRYFWHKDEGDSDSQDVILEYLLLDPTEHFKEVVSDARAVVLAGGTMSPMSDYTQRLFSYVDPQNLQILSCDHVIPRSNLVAMPISTGCSEASLEFTFEKRDSEVALSELGETILQFARVIPDGLVVFFPSYAYLGAAVRHWQKTGPGISTWNRLHVVKAIFQEGQASVSNMTLDADANRNAKTEALLTDYRDCIYNDQNRGGALLFAVIGGSLSEGINFSDRLGRGIAVVGLPFPNVKSPSWKAKLEFVQQKAGLSGAERATAAKELATNTCMRAVNQSIGRAIRHKDDYAAIMLLDRRYNRQDIRSKLPGWIQKSLQPPSSRFADHMTSLKAFFDDKRERL